MSLLLQSVLWKIFLKSNNVCVFKSTLHKQIETKRKRQGITNNNNNFLEEVTNRKLSSDRNKIYDFMACDPPRVQFPKLFQKIIIRI